ncbi:MAG: C_GCAxxG_C_C family protein [Candidatus Hydrogenedentes bacterium]|nr:C_GCAxxG_C_C family protein [Candidatus Hydrogenedentota bacterium]
MKQLGSKAGALGVAGAGVSIVSGADTGEAVAAFAMPPLPWPYTPLDVEETRKRAHGHYAEVHCCAGVFSSIVGGLALAAGHPFDKIPCGMMAYGASGVAGFGSLCGTLNGAGAAVSLVCGKKTTDAVMTELMSWYAAAPLPTATANEYAVTGVFTWKTPDAVRTELAQSVAGDNLCHLSVTRWCKAANLGSGSKERSERCARVTGDVAAKTVELLNAVHDGSFRRAHPLPAQAGGCLQCHDMGERSHTRGKMDCTLCHTGPTGAEHCGEFAQSQLQSPRAL